MRTKKMMGNGLLFSGCLIWIIILVMNLSFGGIATQYTIEYWGSAVKGTEVNVSFKYCFLAGIFLGEITIPVAIGTLIVSEIFEDDEVKDWFH